MLPGLVNAAAGGIQFKIEWVAGSQNVLIRAGVTGFGAMQGAVSTEMGAGLWAYRYLRRYGAVESGWGLGYEVYGLAGAGKNENLLGSTLSMYQHDAFFRAGRSGDFFGLGLGVSRDIPFGSLRKFAVRRGHALVRVANGNHSVHLNFANDFRAGPFSGSARDQGPTGSFHIGYARIDHRRLRRYGLGLDFFTPEPDYARAPDNPQNSADGAKRVWHNTRPWADLFHANSFVMIGQQEANRAWSAKLGVDSAKWGAYVQNRIHDSFGLYPRYPWPVTEPARPYIEAAVSNGDLQ